MSILWLVTTALILITTSASARHHPFQVSNHLIHRRSFPRCPLSEAQSTNPTLLVPNVTSVAASLATINPAGSHVRTTLYKWCSPNGTHTKGVLAGYRADLPGDESRLSVSLLVTSVNNNTVANQTWRHLSDVWTANATRTDIGHASVSQLPSGNILFAFKQHDVRLVGNGTRGGDVTKGVDVEYTRYRIGLSESDDGGYNWKMLGEPEEFPTGLWHPFLRIAKNGTVQVFYSGKNQASNQGINLRWFNDLGHTWSAPVVVTGVADKLDDKVHVSPGMPAMKELMCMFETKAKSANSTTTVAHVTSYDDGFTWSGRDFFYVHPGANGTSASTPQIINTGKTIIFSVMADDAGPYNSGRGSEGSALRMFLSPTDHWELSWNKPGYKGMVGTLTVGTYSPFFQYLEATDELLLVYTAEYVNTNGFWYGPVRSERWALKWN